MSYIITIDGPSGTGKSELAKKIAKQYNFYHVESGLYYRAFAYLMNINKIELLDKTKIEQLIDNNNIEIKEEQVIINNQDITDYIRTNEISLKAAHISTILPLREKINEMIRINYQGQNIVIDGRDAGSVIYPDATIKINLTASLEARAKRRYRQNNEKGIKCSYKEILNLIKLRDEEENIKNKQIIDTTSMHTIDTTNASEEETLNKILAIIRSELK